MLLEDFKALLADESPPPYLHPLLKALWHDANGDWKKAHELAQEVNSAEGSWVHAYLHRKEGDASNAGYWYAKAGRKMPIVSLFDEWVIITTDVLKHTKLIN